MSGASLISCSALFRATAEDRSILQARSPPPPPQQLGPAASSSSTPGAEFSSSRGSSAQLVQKRFLPLHDSHRTAAFLQVVFRLAQVVRSHVLFKGQFPHLFYNLPRDFDFAGADLLAEAAPGAVKYPLRVGYGYPVQFIPGVQDVPGQVDVKGRPSVLMPAGGEHRADGKAGQAFYTAADYAEVVKFPGVQHFRVGGGLYSE